MKNAEKKASAASQRGFNLIELMLAIAIGALISAMVVHYMVGSSRLFTRQGADTLLESNARFAMSYLSQFIRQGGTTPTYGSDVPFYIDTCGAWTPCTSNGVGNESDRMAVQMFPDDAKDCTGNDVDTGRRVANVFYVKDVDGVSALYCRGFDISDESWLGDEMALIDGVEHMQVLYGVANTDEQVYSYLSADNVPEVNSSMLEGWDMVRSAKLALLVTDGTGSGTSELVNRDFQMFDGPSLAYTDKVARQVFGTTVMINNKLK